MYRKTVLSLELTRSTMTFEEFKYRCGNDQVAHIDVMQAPSYPKWLKAAISDCKRSDRKFAPRPELNDHHHENRFLEKRKDLNAIGFTMWSTNGKGKAAEYAHVVARELGVPYRLNAGKFKGCDWDTEYLYSKLPA